MRDGDEYATHIGEPHHVDGSEIEARHDGVFEHFVWYITPNDEANHPDADRDAAMLPAQRDERVKVRDLAALTQLRLADVCADVGLAVFKKPCMARWCVYPAQPCLDPVVYEPRQSWPQL